MRFCRRSLFFTILITLASTPNLPAFSAGNLAGKIIRESKAPGGVVAVLGCEESGLVESFRPNDRFIVQGLTSNPKVLREGREEIQAAGSYGPVSLTYCQGTRLPYVDNSLTLLVVFKANAELSTEEVERVLRPNGMVAFNLKNDVARKIAAKLDIKRIEGLNDWAGYRKPWPSKLDDWTHYMYGPSGNCVSQDRQAGLPRGVRWSGGPKWGRNHEQTASLQAMVSANGILFYVIDKGATESIQLPEKYTLVARDGFNGKIFWERELTNWFNHLYPLKSGPGYLPRRLVAKGERVYIAPGIGQNLLALDAATGEVVHEYQNSASTFEMVISDGTIFAAVDPDRELPDYKQESAHCWSERDRARHKYGWQGAQETRQLKAIDSKTGELEWEKELPIVPMCLATKGNLVCVYSGEYLLGLEKTSGQERWRVKARSIKGNNKFVELEDSTPIDVSKGPFSVDVWIKAARENGVVIAQGGAKFGFSLYLKKGVPTFSINNNKSFSQVDTGIKIPLNQWVHLRGSLTKEKELEIYLNDRLMQTAECGEFISRKPQEGTQIGMDSGSETAAYGKTRLDFSGLIDELKVCRGELGSDGAISSAGELLCHYTFDENPPLQLAQEKNLSKTLQATYSAGKAGKALQLNHNPQGEKGIIKGMGSSPTGYAGPKLFLAGKYVIFSPKGELQVFSSETGKLVWSLDHKPPSGHYSPEDLYVVGDTLWVLKARRKGELTAYNLKTGKRIKHLNNSNKSFYIHPRCYPGKATSEYLFPAIMGATTFNLETENWEINHWVRGGCTYGMMPANGFLYSTPHACACYYQSKLTGFNAMTSDSALNGPLTEKSHRLGKGPAYGDHNLEEELDPRSEWPTFRQDNTRSGSVDTEIALPLKQEWKADLGGELSQPTLAAGKLFVSAIDEHTLYALDSDTGTELWKLTTGGRVDSPPTIYKGMAFFGCADGYVYAVRVSDGKIAWRFQVAPNERQMMSYGQLESVWPLHGSVLIENEILYCVAGRNMFLDGGLRMVLLDPETGNLLSEHVLDETTPSQGRKLQDYIKGKTMPVSSKDILSSDGKHLYMKSQVFDMEGIRSRIKPQSKTTQFGEEKHLFSPIGFLDDSWIHRGYWIYGRAAGEGWGEFQTPPKITPCGKIICLDDENAYAYGLIPKLVCNTSINEYHLYSAKKAREKPAGADEVATRSVNWKRLAKNPLKKLSALEYNWRDKSPDIMAQAMVLANDTLFIAGPRDVVNEMEMWGRSDEDIFQQKMDEQAKHLDGFYGGILMAVSAENGKELQRIELDHLPNFDGLVAAEEKLYMTTKNGSVICY